MPRILDFWFFEKQKINSKIKVSLEASINPTWIPASVQSKIWTNFMFFIQILKPKNCKISFGGIPNSSSKLLAHFFSSAICWNLTEKLRRYTPGIAPEPTWSLVKPGHTKLEPSLERCWTWPGSAPKSPRPSPEPWTWPGVCTSAHRSYSGLKTPLAYAVGEKTSGMHLY